MFKAIVARRHLIERSRRSVSELRSRPFALLSTAALLASMGSGTAIAQALTCPLASLNGGNTLACTLNTITSLTDQLATGVPLTPLQLNQLLGATQAVVVAPFVSRRNDALLSSDIGLHRQFETLGEADDQASGFAQPSRLGGPTNSAISAPYMLGATQRAQPRSTIDIWVEGAFSSFEDGDNQLESDGRAGLLYLGADHRLSPGLLFGALVQFDDAEQKLDAIGSRISDTGWMAGPYAAVRVSDNLFFQARAAWGQSENEVEVADSYNDSFDADRWLVRSTLVGRWASGPWQLRPHISVGYIEEQQDGYAGQLGYVDPVHTSLGQLKFGPEIGYRYLTVGGALVEPRVLIEGIWNFAQSGDDIFIDDLVTSDEMRARAEVGLVVRTREGLAASASVDYDGIGSDDYSAIGGRLRFMVPIN